MGWDDTKRYDLSLLPNESQRFNRESECWAAIDKALGKEEEDGQEE